MSALARLQSLSPAQQVAEHVHKLHDQDSDIRFMSLNDLRAIFVHPTQSAFLAQDYQACAKIIEGLCHTLVDPNGEVQNMTIKCIGPLAQKVHPTILPPMFHKFSNLPASENVDMTISALAIRTMVIALPHPAPGLPRTKAVAYSYEAISKVMVPRLAGHIVLPSKRDKELPEMPKGSIVEDLELGRDSNSIDVLTEIAQCYGSMLQEPEVKGLQEITLRVLENDKASTAMKKKAVAALSALSHYFSEDRLSAVVSHLIESLRNPHLLSGDRKLFITVFGSMARAIPAKFGPHLVTLAPFVMSAVSQQELDEQMQGVEEDEERDPQADEVREAALSALESFISSSSREMTRYLPECVDAILRYLKYDPGMVDDEEEDEEEADDDFELDEDFEADIGADDEDDISWKVRRAAAKALSTVISARGREMLENATLFNRITLALIARFREREESVRVEVLTTLGSLVQKTGEDGTAIENHLMDSVEQSLVLQPQSRKRRRAGSDTTMSGTRKSGRFTGSVSPENRSSPPAGSAASLAKLSNDITTGLVKLIKTSTIMTKQVALSILKDLVLAQQGGFDQILSSILPQLVETVETGGAGGKSSGPIVPSGGSATAATLQVEALQLLAEILKSHSSKLFQSQLPAILRAVVRAVGDRSTRIACTALETLEQLSKSLTPPRSAGATQKGAAQVDQILAAVLELINSKNNDLAVRKDAIQVLAILLGRSFGAQGSKLVSARRRNEALDVLLEASRNETTRYATIKAIDIMAAQVTGDKTGFDTTWASKVCLELAAQLRKADRALRGASLSTLRTLLDNAGASSSIDAASEQQLIAMLVPLLTSDDLHMIGPALLVVSALVSSSPRDVTSQELIDHVCALAASPTAASVLKPLGVLVDAIGTRGSGKPLLHRLLKDIGINASPSVIGKLIGALVVSGGRSVDVKIDDFLKELKSTPDDRRKSLALAVLGEIGIRSGSQAGLETDLFITYFSSTSPDVSLAAANALGRAAAGHGNVKSWVPAILNRIKQKPDEQYLGLHAIRELLQHNENDTEIVPFAGALWESALSASRQSEDNRTLGAECVANLVMIDPPTYLTALQVSLFDFVFHIHDLLTVDRVFSTTKLPRFAVSPSLPSATSSPQQTVPTTRTSVQS